MEDWLIKLLDQSVVGVIAIVALFRLDASIKELTREIYKAINKITEDR